MRSDVKPRKPINANTIDITDAALATISVNEVVLV